MARAIVLPKTLSIVLFFLGLAAALVAVDYVSEFVIIVMDSLTGQAGSIDAGASIWAIIIAAVVVVFMAKSQRAIIALLAGFIAGCLLRFVIMLPSGVI